MFFYSCCCTPSEDNDSLKFDSVLDEYAAGATAQGRGVLQARATGTLLGAHQRPQGEDLAQLKKRLGLAGDAGAARSGEDFYATAATGRACVHFTEDTGHRTGAQYRIDEGGRQLVLTLFGEMGESEVTCPASAIEDIYTTVDGQDCFTEEVLSAATADEREGLFLLIFTKETSREPQALCLMEESAEARDKLLDKLKLLSLSDQFHAD
uniref:Uncharacterized protein n=1 Tax=Zooxanthella nutricula TaxID=1333877 RepID=A0A7S2L6G8_9DINO